MTNLEYLSAWKNVIWRETTPGRNTTHTHFGSVVIPDDVVWNIYNQLENLRGKEVVYFVPGDDDVDWKDRLPPYQIVGSLVDVAKKSDAHECDEHVWVKVNIHSDLIDLPFRGYALHVGFDADKTQWVNPSPILTKEGWPLSVLKSCVVKGLYWHDIRNCNHMFGKNFLFSYYNLRGLNMYIYEPGRCYY